MTGNRQVVFSFRCVFCKHEAQTTVSARDEVVMCPKCFSPMVAIKATA